jgi:pyruvate/2-oxoglutarate dehydrogenase complex dihydrolipoamide acyltransferase (E2) component
VIELRLPELGLDDESIVVSNWHWGVGEQVVQGDRLIELTAGDVTIDLSAPASGLLVEQCVTIDDRLTTGQVLARIQPR